MNKIITWIKQHKKMTALIVILLLPVIIIYKPYKATNPSNPLFVESWFRLSDYGLFRQAALEDALKDLFPAGTPIEYVDKMLVEYGGAEKIDNTDFLPGYYRYRYKPWYLMTTPDDMWINVYCDKDNKVEAVLLWGKPVSGNYDHEKFKKIYEERMNVGR